MNKLIACSALLLGLTAGTLYAAPSKGGPGSACVDVNLSATCSANVVTGTVAVTNCGAAADTIKLTETLVDPSGATLYSETASTTLKAGKTSSFSVIQAVPSNVPPGNYTVTVTGVAVKGGGKDSASLSLPLPCP